MKAPNKSDIQNTLLNWAEYRCVVHAYVCETTQDWGHIGQEEALNSLTRSLLKLRPSEGIDANRIAQCKEQLQAYYQKHNLAETPLEDLKHLITKGQLELEGVVYDVSESEKVNQRLQASGSDWILQWGMYGNTQEIILGRGKTYPDEHLTIYEIEEEFWVSPNTMCAAAAVILHHTIILRLTALETIFNLKWVNGFDQRHWSWGPDNGIGLAIQNKVFQAYEIQNKDDLYTVKETWIQDLKEIVLHHEKGHSIAQHQFLNLKTATFAEATTVFGETIVSSLLEVFADLAVSAHTSGGPLQLIKDIAKHNPKRATRMWWMYCSDTWFFNTENDFMYPYSEMICTLMFAAITEKGTLDFEKIEAILAYAQKLKENLNFCCEKLETWIRTCPEFETWNKEALQTEENRAETEYQKKVGYWCSVFEQVNGVYKDQVSTFFEDEKETVLTQIQKDWNLTDESIVQYTALFKHVLKKLG